MFSRCPKLLLCLVLLTSCKMQAIGEGKRALRVCADPNNLPFTNDRLEGFENKIATLVAKELKASVHYTWWAQRRGFFRSTLGSNRCDVVMGVPAGFDMALTTKPYYRSSYVFLSRSDRNLRIDSFDDPALRRLTIGVQLVGDDSANTPPAHALSRRGITQNVRGYTLYGDYSESNPPARIVDAVRRGDVDVALVWGPLAGYFASRQPGVLKVVPVSARSIDKTLPFVFEISVGVRKGQELLLDEIQSVLDQRQAEIREILDDYGIPRV
jgi:mxaJ protein